MATYTPVFCSFKLFDTWFELVIDRYGNFHLTDTDTDMLIITDADTDKKKINSRIPIRRKGIHRY